MDYDILKKLRYNESEECGIYEDFISLKNNIKNRDKNINATIRITAEALLRYINKKYVFVNVNSKQFFYDCMKNYEFIEYIATYKTVKGFGYNWLKNIQLLGNDTVHNNKKNFDIEDVKDKYIFLLDFAFKILEKELNIKCYNEKIDYEIEFDSLIKNKNIEETITNFEILDMKNIQDKNNIKELKKLFNNLFEYVNNKEIQRV